MGLDLYEMFTYFMIAISICILSVIGYIITGLVYFFYTEPYKIKGEMVEKHTGKYLVKVFYCIGFILIVNMCLKFFSQYIITIKGYTDMFQSKVFINSLKTQTVFPFESLIITMTACSALYTGFEGATSILTNMKQSSNIPTQLPTHKKKRTMYMIQIWFYISIMGALFNFLAGNQDDIFYLGNIFIGLGVTATALFAADRAPKMAAQITVSQDSVLGDRSAKVKREQEEEKDREEAREERREDHEMKKEKFRHDMNTDK